MRAQSHDARGEFYETYFMLISAAVAGLGVALVPRFLVERELQQEKLIVPVQSSITYRSAYFLAYSKSGGKSNEFSMFRSWLMEAVEKYKLEAKL